MIVVAGAGHGRRATTTACARWSGGAELAQGALQQHAGDRGSISSATTASSRPSWWGRTSTGTPPAACTSTTSPTAVRRSVRVMVAPTRSLPVDQAAAGRSYARLGQAVRA